MTALCGSYVGLRARGNVEYGALVVRNGTEHKSACLGDTCIRVTMNLKASAEYNRFVHVKDSRRARRQRQQQEEFTGKEKVALESHPAALVQPIVPVTKFAAAQQSGAGRRTVDAG